MLKVWLILFVPVQITRLSNVLGTTFDFNCNTLEECKDRLNTFILLCKAIFVPAILIRVCCSLCALTLCLCFYTNSAFSRLPLASVHSCCMIAISHLHTRYRDYSCIETELYNDWVYL